MKLLTSLTIVWFIFCAGLVLFSKAKEIWTRK